MSYADWDTNTFVTGEFLGGTRNGISSRSQEGFSFSGGTARCWNVSSTNTTTTFITYSKALVGSNFQNLSTGRPFVSLRADLSFISGTTSVSAATGIQGIFLRAKGPIHSQSSPGSGFKMSGYMFGLKRISSTSVAPALMSCSGATAGTVPGTLATSTAFSDTAGGLRLRMDVKSLGAAGDQIKCYTAPAGSIPGAETWTLVINTTLATTDPAYLPWSATTFQGFCGGNSVTETYASADRGFIHNFNCITGRLA